MRARSESMTAVWLVAVGIGLLFLARWRIPAVYLSAVRSPGRLFLREDGYAPQWLRAGPICLRPIGGVGLPIGLRCAWRFPRALCLAFCMFLVISSSPGFWISAIGVFTAGLAFVLGKISLNTILVLHSSPENVA